jgi:hypothetical protein
LYALNFKNMAKEISTPENSEKKLVNTHRTRISIEWKIPQKTGVLKDTERNLVPVPKASPETLESVTSIGQEGDQV